MKVLGEMVIRANREAGGLEDACMLCVMDEGNAGKCDKCDEECEQLKYRSKGKVMGIVSDLLEMIERCDEDVRIRVTLEKYA